MVRWFISLAAISLVGCGGGENSKPVQVETPSKNTLSFSFRKKNVCDVLTPLSDTEVFVFGRDWNLLVNKTAQENGELSMELEEEGVHVALLSRFDDEVHINIFSDIPVGQYGEYIIANDNSKENCECIINDVNIDVPGGVNASSVRFSHAGDLLEPNNGDILVYENIEICRKEGAEWPILSAYTVGSAGDDDEYAGFTQPDGDTLRPWEIKLEYPSNIEVDKPDRVTATVLSQELNGKTHLLRRLETSTFGLFELHPFYQDRKFQFTHMSSLYKVTRNDGVSIDFSYRELITSSDYNEAMMPSLVIDESDVLTALEPYEIFRESAGYDMSSYSEFPILNFHTVTNLDNDKYIVNFYGPNKGMIPSLTMGGYDFSIGKEVSHMEIALLSNGLHTEYSDYKQNLLYVGKSEIEFWNDERRVLFSVTKPGFSPMSVMQVK